MSETPRLSLPLIAPSQTQKFVPVNEALTRLDALFMPSAKGRTMTAPPAGPAEGDRWIVPAGATGAWASTPEVDTENAIAVAVNGGWDFVTPLTGWRAWVEDEQIEVIFDSGAWSPLIYSAPAITNQVNVLTFQHAPSGTVSDTAGQIPANSMVFAVTARVVSPLTGLTGGWSLGVAEAPSRYGSGHGAGLNSVIPAPTGAPMAHPQATPLRMSAAGGSFTGGTVEFNVHYMTFASPDAV